MRVNYIIPKICVALSALPAMQWVMTNFLLFWILYNQIRAHHVAINALLALASVWILQLSSHFEGQVLHLLSHLWHSA